ncbi:MAG: hypothetical protein ABI583_11505 [Betaproteobacteria bacterium]
MSAASKSADSFGSDNTSRALAVSSAAGAMPGMKKAIEYARMMCRDRALRIRAFPIGYLVFVRAALILIPDVNC